MIEVHINGESTTVEPGTTITQLLTQRVLEVKFCAVEVNEEIIPRQLFDVHALADGDRLEIVTLVGGG